MVILLEEFLFLITENFLAPLRGRVERFAKQFWTRARNSREEGNPLVDYCLIGVTVAKKSSYSELGKNLRV